MDVSPTLQQVQDAAVIQGVRPEIAEDFWEFYEIHNWEIKPGQKLSKWQVALKRWSRDPYGIQAEANARKAKNRPVHGPPKVCRECGKPGTSWIGGKCGACYNKELRV